MPSVASGRTQLARKEPRKLLQYLRDPVTFIQLKWADACMAN
jgi:hypothetical protein